MKINASAFIIDVSKRADRLEMQPNISKHPSTKQTRTQTASATLKTNPSDSG